MQRPSLGAIWAQSTDGIIGDGAGMPWHLPEDLQHFKQITSGHPVIMGRRTWESLPVKPLPGRKNIVISSRGAGSWSRGASVVSDIPDLAEDAWIIGGAQIYAATLDEVDVIERTLIDVHPNVPASNAVYAPRIDDDFTLVEETGWMVSSTSLRYKFQRFERA